MAQLYKINKFNGWMSNDDYIWIAWAVVDAKNVDLSSSKWITLSRNYWFTNSPTLLNTRANWKIVAMLEGNAFTNRLVLTNDVRLTNYSLTEVQYTWTWAAYNMWSITDNTWAREWFILWANWEVHTWSINESDSSLWIWASAVNITQMLQLPTVDSLQPFFHQKAPFLVKQQFLYVTAWNNVSNQVFTIDTSTAPWTVQPDVLKIDAGYTITYMSNIWDQIIIYASNGTNGKQYYWDWITANYDRYIQWYDRAVLGWVGLNNIDYVVSWTSRKRQFYSINGYQPNRLFGTDVYVKNKEQEKFFIETEIGYSNIFETIEETILMPWVNWLYKYWNNNIWFTKWVTRDYIPGDITMLYYNDVNSDRIIIWINTTKISWSNGNYLLENNIRQPDSNTSLYSWNITWIVKTLKFDGWMYGVKKDAIKARVGYKLVNTTTNWSWINIYARVNNGLKYANFYTVATNFWSYTTAPAVWDTYTNDGQTWTIYDITDKRQIDNTELKNKWLILHCTTTDLLYDGDSEGNYTWTLTKATWWGDSTFVFYMADYWFKLVKKINYNNVLDRVNKTTFMLWDLEEKFFNEIQIKFDLFTLTNISSPTIYDFWLLYNVVEEDLE